MTFATIYITPPPNLSLSLSSPPSSLQKTTPLLLHKNTPISSENLSSLIGSIIHLPTSPSPSGEEDGGSYEVIGLKDTKNNIHYPLSILGGRPGDFEGGVFEVIALYRRNDNNNDNGNSLKQQYDYNNNSESENTSIHPESETNLKRVTGYSTITSDSNINLSSTNIRSIMNLFRSNSHVDGTIDYWQFKFCLSQILGLEVSTYKYGNTNTSQSQLERSRRSSTMNYNTMNVLSKIYSTFTKTSTGAIDTASFLNGLISITRCSARARLRISFELYDVNGDGYITKDEMTAYLISLFTLSREEEDGKNRRLFESYNVTVEELAVATMEACFAEGDVNCDGVLSWEEFEVWFGKADGNGAHTESVNEHVNEHAQTHAKKSSEEKEKVNPVLMVTLNQIKQITKLSNFTTTEIFEMFNQCISDDGMIHYEDYFIVLDYIDELTPSTPNNGISTSKQILRKEVCNQIFYSLQVTNTKQTNDLEDDGYNLKSHERVLSALSVLTSGSLAEKFHLTFTLFDPTNTGYITLPAFEVFLTSVFTVLYLVDGGRLFEEIGVGPEELARDTVEEAKVVCEVAGLVSLEEFKRWYELNPTADQAEGVTDGGGESEGLSNSSASERQRQPQPQPQDHSNSNGNGDGNGNINSTSRRTSNSRNKSNLKRTKKLLNLTQYPLSTVFEVFAQHSDDRGMLNRAAFMAAFYSLVYGGDGMGMGMGGGREGRRRSDALVISFTIDRIFECFATSTIASTVQVGSGSGSGSGNGRNVQVEEVSVSFDEIACGLSVLCSGSTRDKVSSCFQVVGSSSVGSSSPSSSNFNDNDSVTDENVTFSELCTYLISALKVLNLTSTPSSSSSSSDNNMDVNMDPENMGVDMARSAFDHGGVTVTVTGHGHGHEHGRLGFEGFMRWCSNSNSGVGVGGLGFGYDSDDSDSDDDDEESEEDCEEESEEEEVTMEEVQRITGLEDQHVEDVFDLFSTYTNSSGVLTKQAFTECILTIIQGRLKQTPAHTANVPPSASRIHLIISTIFSSLDVNSDNFISYPELASGISVLCGGTRDDKVMAAFSLFDADGDGFITLGEMTVYLTAMFNVLFRVCGEARRVMLGLTGTGTGEGVGPEEMARATAEQAFRDVDVDGDGRLSFREFTVWYMQANANANGGEEEEETKPSPNPSPNPNQTHPGEPFTLSTIRRLTTFKDYTADVVFDLFLQYADEGSGDIDYNEFKMCMQLFGRFDSDVDDDSDSNDDSEIDDLKSRDGDDDDVKEFNKIIKSIFSIFTKPQTTPSTSNQTSDQKQKQKQTITIKTIELCSGLSVLCGGPRDAKAYAAFRLFNQTQSRSTRSDEITITDLSVYLTSVFQILFWLQPGSGSGSGSESVQESAEGLGWVTAVEAFEYAGIDVSGGNGGKGLTFDLFRRWYNVGGLGDHDDEDDDEDDEDEDNESDNESESESDSNSESKPTLPPVPSTMTIAKIEQLTKIHKITPARILEILATSADDYGLISVDGLYDCLLTFTLESNSNADDNSGGEEEEEQTDFEGIKVLAFELFELFAFDSSTTTTDDDNDADDANDDNDEEDDDEDDLTSNKVDFTELSLALTLLSGSSRKSKIKSAFDLFDGDTEGFVCRDDMIVMIDSLCRILEYVGREGVDVERFLSCCDGDGGVGFRDFGGLYPRDYRGDREDNEEDDSEGDDESPSPSPSNDDVNETIKTTLKTAQKILGLSCISPNDLLEILAEASSHTDGTLTKAAFLKCMNNVSTLSGRSGRGQDYEDLKGVCARVFETFSPSSDNVQKRSKRTLNVTEVTSGLALLTSSSIPSKITTAFKIHDGKNTGKMSIEQCTMYATNAFKVIYACCEWNGNGNDLRSVLGVDALELAVGTVGRCFEEVGIGAGGGIGREEVEGYFSMLDIR